MLMGIVSVFTLKIKVQVKKKFKFRLLEVSLMKKIQKMVKDAEANKEADKEKRVSRCEKSVDRSFTEKV